MRIIAGRWKGHGIKSVRGRDVRPTTDRIREAWMSALGDWLKGARVLDLFAGSGALGLEALSRGALEVVFVERSRSALRILRSNVERLEAGEEVRIVRGDAMSWVAGLEEWSFDLALADPPYERGLAAELVRRFQRVPFARELWVEHRSSEELPEVPGMRQRRYGDTTLTTLISPGDDT